jgi:hypothetical protein
MIANKQERKVMAESEGFEPLITLSPDFLSGCKYDHLSHFSEPCNSLIMGFSRTLKKSHHPFEHTYVDLRYLDAKPAGVQLYSCLLLEGFSRTILAGSLTPEQEVGVVLHVYFQALLRWGLWEELVSDHGGQFISLSGPEFADRRRALATSCPAIPGLFAHQRQRQPDAYRTCDA